MIKPLLSHEEEVRKQFEKDIENAKLLDEAEAKIAQLIRDCPSGAQRGILLAVLDDFESGVFRKRFNV